MAGLRRFLIAVPLAALVALITHEVRFGNDHEFGLELHGLIVELALGGIFTLGAAAFGRALLLTAHADGSVIATRLRAMLPGGGALLPLAALVAAQASAIYFGVEATEPHGDGPNALAFAMAAALSLALAACVGLIVGAIAQAAVTLAALGTHLGRAASPAPRRWAPVTLPVAGLHAGGRRFGRAPPD